MQQGPGLKVEHACDIAVKTANEQNASEVILHIGTNNITSNDPVDIATQIESIGDQILTKCATVKQVTLSSIISRRTGPSHMSKINEVNNLLRSLQIKRNWGFIDNNNIDPDAHLNQDGIHLSTNGIKILAGNIIRHLRGESASICRPNSVSALARPAHPSVTTQQSHGYEYNDLQRQGLEHTPALYSDVLKFVPEPMSYPQYTGCYNCGERNHSQQKCRYDDVIRCHNCRGLGHKAKYCNFSDNYMY